jgi:hypothetical protein
MRMIADDLTALHGSIYNNDEHYSIQLIQQSVTRLHGIDETGDAL